MKMEKYFLEETCPFTKRRKIKWKTIQLMGGLALALTIVSLLVFTPGSERGPRPENASRSTSHGEGSSSKADSNLASNPSGDPFRESSYSRAAKSARQYGASQLVRRSDGGNNGDKLPIGSTLAAKLINSVLSSDKDSPIIGEIPEDIIWKNSVIIPAQTKVIGQGILDPGTERLQTRFNTLVYPDGDQHSISALALLTDGSSGIAGNFHSRTFPNQAGRFFGNFIGGLAQGMKEKQSSGSVGLTFEPGSLTNGLLNGLSESSLDQASSYAQSAEKLNPYLEVPGNTPFVLYLEKEYSP